MQALEREKEIEQLKRIYEGERCWEKLYQHFVHTFGVLHARVVVVLTLCGAVVTVTGFSGRIIASTGVFSQILMVTGLTLVLCAAGIAVFRVLPVYWLSQMPGDDLDVWLRGILAYRDRKTRAYKITLVFLLLGLASYLAAVAIMILMPENAPLHESIR